MFGVVTRAARLGRWFSLARKIFGMQVHVLRGVFTLVERLERRAASVEKRVLTGVDDKHFDAVNKLLGGVTTAVTKIEQHASRLERQVNLRGTPVRSAATEQAEMTSAPMPMPTRAGRSTFWTFGRRSRGF